MEVGPKFSNTREFGDDLQQWNMPWELGETRGVGREESDGFSEET